DRGAEGGSSLFGQGVGIYLGRWMSALCRPRAVESGQRRPEVARGRGASGWPRIPTRMNEITRILSAIERGDGPAAEQLLPLVYDELRRLAAEKMAHEKPGHTLQATALVHEAYVRLVDADNAQHWNSRGHF